MTLLAHRGEIPANATKGGDSLLAAKGAGDLLLYSFYQFTQPLLNCYNCSTTLIQPQTKPEQQAGCNHCKEKSKRLHYPIRVDMIDSQIRQTELHPNECIHAKQD